MAQHDAVLAAVKAWPGEAGVVGTAGRDEETVSRSNKETDQVGRGLLRGSQGVPRATTVLT